jgi:FtsP/CotA-like multicopper oxidase with cupredoxin domain
VRVRTCAAAGVAAIAFISGCAAASSTQRSPDPTPAQATSAQPPTATAHTPATPTLRDLDESSKGQTIRVNVGDTVRLTLHSTYWQLDPPSGSAVQAGPSDVVGSPAPIPGTGAGTVTTSYLAKAAGTAVIAARRTSCGEAMGCAPDQASFTVTLTVNAS